MTTDTIETTEINEPQTVTEAEVNEDAAVTGHVAPEPDPVKSKPSKEAKGKKTVAKTAKTAKTAKPEKPAKSAKTEKPASKPSASRPVAKANSDILSKARSAANNLDMLGDATRLAIIMFLKDEEISVGSLCGMVDQSQPATSHHLALLRHSGMIEGNRQGKQIYYSLTEKGERMAEIAEQL